MNLSRRDCMSAVAALAASQWDDEPYNIEDAEQWDPLSGGTYPTGSVSPGALSSSGYGPATKWLLEDDAFTDRRLEVYYSPDGVHITAEATADGEGVRSGSVAELDPEQAREIAAALYRAAEEYERRPEEADSR